MKITKLVALFEEAAGFKALRTNSGYKFEVVTDLVTAEISLAEIKRQCRSYCARRIEDIESEAAFCNDYEQGVWLLECADNWRKTLNKI